MGYLAAVVLFPLLFWLRAGGCGLLVERICSTRLPGLLIAPVGFAVLVVVSQLTTWVGAIAPATPLVLAALAALGYVLGSSPLRGWLRERRHGWWIAPAAALVTYLIAAAPWVGPGRPTSPAEPLATTPATQIPAAAPGLQRAHPSSARAPLAPTLA